MMAKALKEEYVPAWWQKWRETDSSQRLRAQTNINVPVDIVAVQGLASTYEWTWRKDISDGRSIMWLRDLLKTDLPNARVMSFEYDSRWLNDPAMVSLEDCGDRLLESIIWDRTHRRSREMCPIMARRPLILLGHSYGGLVIKQALVTAATASKGDPRYNDYQAFLTAVSGVMFLGTPHGGSSFASAGLFQANFKSWFGGATNTDILKPLALDTVMTTLKDLEEDFQELLSHDRLSGLISFYFYETKPLTMGPFKTGLVVGKDSACYGSPKSARVPLDANHMEMNKFGGRYESNYIRLIEKLTEIHVAASKTVQLRWGRYQYDTHYPGGAVKEIKHWLSPENVFSEEYVTRRTDRLGGTCDWAYQVDILADWLGSYSDGRTPRPGQSPPLLVVGKAGSGKSVLAAYLHRNLEERFRAENWSADDASRCSGSSDAEDCQQATVTENKAALYFPVSKSTKVASVIRTLIDQLLHFQPTNSGLQDVIRSKLTQKHVKECTSDVGVEILVRLLRTFSSVHIIIDGLDECDKPGEIIRHLKNVRQIKAIKLLLLSRHDHELDMLISRQDQEVALSSDSLGFTKLDIAHYNADDIDRFIADELQNLTNSNSYVREETDSVRHLISKDARGMFQWVKLVLYQLNFASSKDEVSRFLQGFPRGLNEAYSTTFERLSQAEGFDKEGAILVLKILSAAYRPLQWLDLAVAFQLHGELRNHPKLNFDHVGEMVNAATKRAYELPDSYFAFLGPLVDIRSTDQTADTATWNSITDGRGSRSVVICHHSLTQWIEGTASAIKKSSEWWQEFHFTRIDAHKPLALLCLVTISSGKNLSKFLQDIYVPFRCTSPFLNYAGEYWSFHLRAAGGWTSTDHQREVRYRDGPTKNLVLVDFAATTLEKGIDTAAGVCLALSTAVKSIDVQKIGSLPKVAALRRLETTILPATRAIGRLQSVMTDVSTTLLEIQAELGLSSADYNPGVLFDMATTTLDSNLDSETVLRVSATLRTSASGSATSHLLSRERRRRKEHIKIICEASRALRQLAILLAVDPVRAWIYSLIGDSGVSPLAALSHTSDAIDTYLAASLLPPELFSQYDFRDQFNAQHNHPQYGLITAARRELSAQNDGSLDATFYKEHVGKHYRISAWEWNTTRVLIAALEAFPEDPLGMDTAIKIWISSNKLWPKPSSDNNFEPAFEVINRLRSQNIYRSAARLKELLSTLIRGGAVFCFKYIIHLVPPLEHVFLSALMSGRMVRAGLAPTLKLLTGNWKDFVFVFLLYLIRCRYFPWLFGTAQTLHWNSIFGPIYDIRGIIADPKGYVPPFAPTSWPWLRFIYYMVQEVVIWSQSVLDVISAQSVSEGGVTFDILPESLLRRTSFRFDWNNGDTRGQFEKLRKATASHAFAFFVTLRRLLVVERLLGTAVGWVFDLLNAAAGMAHSSPWKGKSMLFYGVQMVSFAYSRSIGVVGGLKLLLRICLWSALFSWYHPSSLFGLTYRYAYLPAKNISTRACARYIDNILAKVSSFSKLIDALEATIIQAVQGLHVRTLLFTLAGAICTIGLLFWYIMSDPLSLGSAARSCQEAEDLARKTTSIQDPVTFLKWRSDKPEKEHAIAFTDRSLDDYDAEE